MPDMLIAEFNRSDNPCGCNECRVCAMFGTDTPLAAHKCAEVAKAFAGIPEDQNTSERKTVNKREPGLWDDE
jgi:hypothetical protein